MTTPSPISPEAERTINETIARFCGYTVIDAPFIPAQVNCNRETVFTDAARREMKACYPASNPQSPPNYTRSLDASALAESRLSDEQYWEYVNDLEWSSFRRDKTRTQELRDYISATAMQRSLALVKVIESSVK